MSSEGYWQKEGAKKTFTHSINSNWLEDVDRDTLVLDFGCGYGRLTPQLLGHGFNSLVGYDPSAALIARAEQENPGAIYTKDFETLRHHKFGLVLCFAVFTSCPTDEEQAGIIESIESVTGKGSLLYISDYVMQDNPGYQQRYEQRVDGVLGRFTSGSGNFRHHETTHFQKLLSAWQLDEDSSLPGKTMNGNDIVIHQYRFVRT